MPEFDPEAFASLAAAMGINADVEHLDLLRVEVQATIARLVELDAIDVSDVPAEEAGLRHDGPGGAA